MGNYQAVIDLMKQKVGKAGWTTQVYIKLAQDATIGAFLDRVVWWSDKSGREDGYFWKTTQEWEEELFISYAQIKRIEKKLTEMRLIETKKFMVNGSMTMHYRPMMPNILEKIEAVYTQTNFEKVELQESRSSKNLNLELQESRSSELQESRSSITSKTHQRQQQEGEAHEDYLGAIVNGQGQVTGVTDSNPEDQYFEYRDEFLNTYRDMTGEYPEPLVKDEISNLITIGITPAIWLESWRQCKLNWSGKNKIPLVRVIEVCKFGGDYEKWRRAKYPEGTNGRDSPGPPKPKYVTIPVTSQEGDNND